jgi:hypothetical protein
MDTHHVEISVRPLSEWPDDQVARVYALLASDVRELLARPDADPQELAAARRDAEVFGVEAVRRGILSA